jgi:ADP-ribose pyrophosphatase YjhB (NUDIX family)
MSTWRIRYEPLITPVFRVFWRLRRPMTLGVRGVVTDENGAVLLVRHTYAKGWHLPGGGVERGETALDSLTRELAEEGGVCVDEIPTLVGCYSNHANFPNDHVLVYLVAAWRSCPPRVDHEIAERGFYALDALPPDITGGTKRRLAELFDGAETSAHW